MRENKAVIFAAGLVTRRLISPMSRLLNIFHPFKKYRTAHQQMFTFETKMAKFLQNACLMNWQLPCIPKGHAVEIFYHLNLNLSILVWEMYQRKQLMVSILELRWKRIAQIETNTLAQTRALQCFWRAGRPAINILWTNSQLMVLT